MIKTLKSFKFGKYRINLTKEISEIDWIIKNIEKLYQENPKLIISYWHDNFHTDTYWLKISGYSDIQEYKLISADLLDQFMERFENNSNICFVTSGDSADEILFQGNYSKFSQIIPNV